MKKYLLLMLPLCLLLTGCAPSRREAVQAYYKSIRTAQMEAHKKDAAAPFLISVIYGFAAVCWIFWS